MCSIDSWLAYVIALLNRFARTLIQIGEIIRPEGRLQDLVAYLLLGGQTNVVTVRAFFTAEILKQALLHAKASQTNIP